MSTDNGLREERAQEVHKGCCAVVIQITEVTHVESRVRLVGRKALLTAESLEVRGDRYLANYTLRISHLQFVFLRPEPQQKDPPSHLFGSMESRRL